MDEKIGRRQIYKRWAGVALGSWVTGVLFSSTVASVLGFVSHVKKDQGADSTPYIPTEVEEPSSQASLGKILDAHIDKIPGRLLGVNPAREFTQEYYLVLEELVKGCSCAVLEVAPGLVQTGMSNNAKVYYGTMVELCRRYHKSVIFLNPCSVTGELIEELVGLSGAVYGSVKSFKIIGENSKRRDFLANSMKTLAGMYLFASSPIISEPPRIMLREITGFEPTEHRMDTCFINHYIDQANVQITNRLLYVSKRLTPQELRNGDYILVSFSERHVAGVDYYLRHPVMRGIKSALYRFTYDLVDSDAVVKFVPGQNSWVQIRIPYS